MTSKIKSTTEVVNMNTKNKGKSIIMVNEKAVPSHTTKPEMEKDI